MKMITFDLTKIEFENILKLKKYAENNYVTAELLECIKEGKLEPAGKNPNYTCKISEFTIGFSIEQQPDPVGFARHISISRENGDITNPVTVSLILSNFGFKEVNPLNSYFHIDTDANPKVVHIIEPLNGWQIQHVFTENTQIL
jgi:hypothetical protein